MKSIAWVVGICFVLFCIAWFNVDNIRDWFFPNVIEVNAYGEADVTKVKVDWTAEALNDTVTLFINGEQVDEDFRGQGYNFFLLYYENQFIGTFEQFKSNKNSGHTYNFMIWQSQDSVQADLKIKGPEAPL